MVETINRNNEQLAKHKIGFQRINPGLQLDESAIKAIDITSTFAEKISSLDSLRFYLQQALIMTRKLKKESTKNTALKNIGLWILMTVK